jgi:hypothetical protein
MPALFGSSALEEGTDMGVETGKRHMEPAAAYVNHTGYDGWFLSGKDGRT